MAEVFRRAGSAYRERMAGRLDVGRLKVMAAIEACRTAALGGHIYACDGCGREHPLYNSCRNRHCPTCQGMATNRWSEARAAELLPVPYFHVVFTLPVEIAAIAFCNRRIVFDILFRTVAETLRTIAADPRHGGLRVGGTAVLHTWDQRLRFHPHLHVVVPNAGFDVEGGAWKTGSGTWLAPVKVLASLFRRRFLEELARAHRRGRLEFHGTVAHLANPGEFHAALAAARGRDWVVYAKRPFRGPVQVFRYLARYTHRIAISDSRITAFDGETVSFRHRKPKQTGQRSLRYGTMTVGSRSNNPGPSVTYLRPRETSARVRSARCSRSVFDPARGDRRHEKAGGSAHEGKADRTRAQPGPSQSVDVGAPDVVRPLDPQGLEQIGPHPPSVWPERRTPFRATPTRTAPKRGRVWP